MPILRSRLLHREGKGAGGGTGVTEIKFQFLCLHEVTGGTFAAGIKRHCMPRTAAISKKLVECTTLACATRLALTLVRASAPVDSCFSHAKDSGWTRISKLPWSSCNVHACC